MGYNLELNDRFDDVGQEGTIEVRFIREKGGVCLCAFYDNDWYYLPLANIKDKTSFNEMLKEFNREVGADVSSIKGTHINHVGKVNPHDTRIKNLKDIKISSASDADSLVWDGTTSSWKNTRVDYKHINTFTNAAVAAGVSSALDLSTLTANTLKYTISGTGIATITGISNATIGAEYVFYNANASGTNKLEIKNAVTIETPRGLDLQIEPQSIATFVAVSSTLIVCKSYSDNVT